MDKFFKKINNMKYILICTAVAVCGTIYIAGRLCSNAQETDSRQILYGTDIEASAESGEEQSFSLAVDTETTACEERILYIYVCGCVNHPGVYTVKQPARVYELIEMAGGFGEGADETALNLVDIVSDGQKLYVPEKGEVLPNNEEGVQGSSGLVNLNTADKAVLMTLPGIGEAKAEDILQYRKSKGAFQRIEDIKNISGIKDAAFNKIKDLICV